MWECGGCRGASGWVERGDDLEEGLVNRGGRETFRLRLNFGKRTGTGSDDVDVIELQLLFNLVSSHANKLMNSFTSSSIVQRRRNVTI